MPAPLHHSDLADRAKQGSLSLVLPRYGYEYGFAFWPNTGRSSYMAYERWLREVTLASYSYM